MAVYVACFPDPLNKGNRAPSEGAGRAEGGEVLFKGLAHAWRREGAQEMVPLPPCHHHLHHHSNKNPPGLRWPPALALIATRKHLFPELSKVSESPFKSFKFTFVEKHTGSCL